MTTITSITKTYTKIDGGMKHTGYFISTNNHRLKYATKWTWETAVKSATFKLSLDEVISRLEDAQ